MGIFARIKKAWYDSIIWETIDEDFYDELEESLIMADLGAAVAAAFPMPEADSGEILTNARQADAVRRALEYLRAAREAMAAGFAPDAVLTAVETRSSSPVRIVRDNTYQTALRGLYPCGEGAGYAGGILSAAADGMRCAEQIIKEITQHG